MKRLLIFALVMVLTLTGCSSFIRGVVDGASSGGDAEPDGGGTKTQTVKSTASALTIEVPSSWEKADLNDIASIGMAHFVREQYIVVIEENSADFIDDFSLSDYASIILENMSSLVDSAESDGLTDAKVGGEEAKQFELSGSVDRIKVKYHVTFAKVNGIFYQFCAWSLQSRYDDAKKVFEDILASAKF